MPHAAVKIIMLSAWCVLLTGCAPINKFLDHSGEDERRAAELLQLQQGVMRFADEYTASIAEPLRQFQLGTTDPVERLAAQTWMVSQATAAFTIATGADPRINALDMVVFATLSRMVIDDLWITERYGARADPIRHAHAKMEEEAWSRVKNVLTPAQGVELKQLIAEWRARNPAARSVAYIHFDVFAESIGRTTRGLSIVPGSLFGLLGLDPLSTLDPAVRELTQARQLAERALYFAERTPNLVDMQAQRAALQFAAMPETVGLLQDAHRASAAAEQAANLADQLPDLIARERAAAIDQLARIADAREGPLRALLVELHSALEAGTATADSLNTAIASFDQLLARLGEPASPSSQPGRPFDITEYTATAEALGEAARRVDLLLKEIDANGAALDTVSEQASQRATILLDHLFWRLVQLVLVGIGASVLGALAYRIVARIVARRLRDRTRA